MRHPRVSFSPPSKPLGQLGDGKSNKARLILAGALEVFTAHGYSAASMDRIAAAAGVSKSTLYSYFQDKEGLFVALIQQLTAKNRQRLLDVPIETVLQAPPEQFLREMATSMLAEFSDNQPLLTLLRLLIGESARFPELGKTFIREIQKPMLERLALYLASQTHLQLPDPMVTARVFSGALVHYLITQKIMHGEDIIPIERDRMVEGLVQLITARGGEEVKGEEVKERGR